MNKNAFIVGTIFAMTAVILGAFGAHALKAQLDPDSLDSFRTGVRYQMWHALVLLFVSVNSEKMKIMNIAPILFSVGIVLFSGSIYILSCKTVLGLDNVSWLGPITPLGGLLIIAGWGSLLMSGLKWKRS